MGIFTASEPFAIPYDAQSYEQIMASIQDLAVKLDAMADDYAMRIAANEADIISKQAENAEFTVEEMKAKELSAKLKSLAPSTPAPVVESPVEPPAA